jgi:hypothetical protein
MLLLGARQYGCRGSRVLPAAMLTVVMVMASNHDVIAVDMVQLQLHLAQHKHYPLPSLFPPLQ